MKTIKLAVITFLAIFTASCSSDNDNTAVEENNGNQPQITTDSPQYTGSSSAILGGTVTDDGGSTINRYGICWSTSSNPTIDSGDFVQEYNLTSNSFTLNITALIPNTTYYYRAFCENSNGLQYGNALSFSTGNATSTLSAKNILTTKATLKGHVTAEPSASTFAGFVYGPTPNPTINDSSVGTYISGDDDYEIQISNLSYNTVYYFRSYTVVHTNETNLFIYGEQKQFRTTGYTGPAGGYVAVDMGEENGGWRYLEIHPTSLQHPSSNGYGAHWGTSGYISGISDQFGSGLQNTQMIVNNVTSSNCAARLCYDLTLNGYSDWFLPSKDEALTIANTLRSANIVLSPFWTSTQFDEYYAYSLSSGSNQHSAEKNVKNYTSKVLPVRRY